MLTSLFGFDGLAVAKSYPFLLGVPADGSRSILKYSFMDVLGFSAIFTPSSNQTNASHIFFRFGL